MTQALSPDTQAILLLCGRFGGARREGPAPLTDGEYAKLAAWLLAGELRPSDLVAVGGASHVEAYDAVPGDRLKRLLERGAQLAMQVEEWQRKGMWVIGRGDDAYPRRWKRRLGRAAPPLVYGTGPVGLLGGGGVAVVGSRDAGAEGEAFAGDLARRCAASGLNVVSGGARGIDTAAMRAAVACEGSTVGILADNLERAMLQAEWRDAIVRGDLLLVSVAGPRVRFQTAIAMARNKLIYSLADHAVVVSAARGRGGTWTGATENLRKGWVPLFVRSAGEDGADEVPEGNRALLEGGCAPLPPAALAGDEDLGGWFAAHAIPAARAGDSGGRQAEFSFGTAAEAAGSPPAPLPEADVFEQVWPLLARALRDWRTAEALAEAYDLRVAQVRDWMARAVAEGLATKRGRPVRYRVSAP